MTKSIISLSNVCKSYKRNNLKKQVIKDISFTVKKGEVVTLLGESGCGKSSILNLVGGFIFPDEGKVLVNEKVVTKPERNCIILFQQHNLLPWRTVLDNVVLGLSGESKLKREKAIKVLELVDLKAYLTNYPHELSGGMQQRVAIARAFAMQPDVILMDEPFAALDTFNRYHLQDELIRMQEQEQLTILLVTHDIDEAVYLSDRILIMSSNPGEIYQTISIDLPKPRSRSNDAFHYYRSKIFETFKLSNEVNKPEYFI